MTRICGKEYRTIYGGHTCNVCGYCFSHKHRGALTVQHMKKHKCLKKKCDRFAKFEDHNFWKRGKK